MPKIGYSANGFGKFCEVYEAVETSVEAVDAMDAVVADGGSLEDPQQGPRDAHCVPVALC